MKKSKAQLNWEVGKELEQRLKYALLEFYPSNIIDGIDIDEFFKQIRQNEYRRGKEDTLKEVDEKIKELKNKLRYYWDTDEHEALEGRIFEQILNEIFGRELCE